MGKGRTSNSRARRSRAKRSAPPDVESRTAGSSSRLAQNDNVQATTSARSRKRALDTASADQQSSVDKPAPVKKERLAPADTPGESYRRSARLQTQQPAAAQSPPSVIVIESTVASETPACRRRRRAGRRKQKNKEAEVREEITVGGQAGDVGKNRHREYRPRLTQENLSLLNTITSDGSLGGVSGPSEYSVHSSLGTGVKTTTTATSYLAVQAMKNGVFDSYSSKMPANLDDIRNRCDGARGSSPDNELMYKDYVEAVNAARNSSTLTVETSGLLLKKYRREGYKKAYNRKFTSFPKDAGINEGLSVPVPTFVEGLQMEEFQPLPVDETINGAVLYKYDPCSLTLPHLAGEWSLYGTQDKVRWRSAYHGAALVYARNKALAYLGMSDPPGHAEVITFTSTGSRITLYAHYSSVSVKGKTEYHQYPIITTNMLDTLPGFEEGRTALQCAQDYAREVSYTLRNELKDYWEEHLHPDTEESDLPVANGTSVGDSEDLPDADGTSVGDSEDDEPEDSEQPSTPTTAAPGSSIEVAWE